ncbi:Holliday junction resolvase RecU [[Mycoplasma] testudinis]|uniref:Holliday junction resolvase RecU n=1 Tax=[Mycoplasma] testudinis TaxID=33924 RepID=UPI000484A853|nr:Holliday junction resolvase RecU [[Mycoplasma] testudinis]
MNANRGMFLETIINRTIDYFNNRQIAYFAKRYLPIKVYAFQGQRVQGWLKERTQSDYYGVYKGYYFDFEAKQVSLKSFPLKNLAPHQLNHLKNIINYQAVSFLIVLFNTYEKFFVLETSQLIKYIQENNDKKSIPYEYFEKYAYQIDLIFPGVLNLQDVLELLVKNKNPLTPGF